MQTVTGRSLSSCAELRYEGSVSKLVGQFMASNNTSRHEAVAHIARLPADEHKVGPHCRHRSCLSVSSNALIV
jgi:hypothetical protein